ncbi:hypothetical protein EVG20_g6377 [Dentipellis fragilis]|uniref:Deoxyribonuclease NucA/NucB domain-containing protein n=1 Tax=Dentipellis fragilis TaxID=205917 RepID=A0A4Y9YNR8_9AGAM|nr:hypothetical protein EVG20_g6377 [Dentipellis fragilis]
MARATSFATLLSLLLFLIAPSILSVSGPLAVSAAVTEPAFDVLNNGVEPVDIAARKASSAKKPAAKPPTKAPTVPAKPPPAKAPPVKASSVAPVKVTSAAPVKVTSAAPVKVTSAPVKVTSAAPVKASSAPVKVSSAASSVATSKAATVKASSSATASSASASASSTSAAACAIKRTGTAGASAAAACNTCDPCDDSCDTNVQEPSTRKRAVLPEDEPEIRTIYGNDTSPFFPGEHVRIRIVEKRANPVLEFDCSANGIPDVCQNMCYGVFCRGHPQTLTRNSANKPTCAAARKLNSCGIASPNRCSAKHSPPFAAGNSCDEYPFASTLEGQQAGTGGRPSAVTRCVVARHNSVQGGKISGIYNKVPQQGQFDIEFDFGNGAAGTGYCAANAATTTCATLTGSQQNN